jgi:zinc protease
MLELIADIVIRPTLPESELESRRTEVITAIRQDEDSPFVQASENLLRMLYGSGHPYGRAVKGSAANVHRITREELSRLHAARFAPSEAIAVIVGDVEAARAVDAAARVFGGWRAPAPAPIPLAIPPAPAERRRLVIPMMNKVQAEIAYGFIAVSRSDPAYYAVELMNNVLGQYAMGGRLGDNIRERQGMAYHVSSGLEPAVVDAPLVIRAGVSAANVDRAVAAIDAELAQFLESGVSAEELEESRDYLIGSMPRALETNAGIASFLLNAEFFELGMDHDVRLPPLLQAVTLDDVHAAGRRILDPARATVVVAGPYEGT